MNFYNPNPSSEIELFQLAHSLSRTCGTIFLYSGGTLESAQKSFLWALPFDHIRIKDQRIFRNNQECGSSQNIWEALANQLGCGSTWAGFFGYEMGVTPSLYPTIISLPDAYLQRSCLEVVFDHALKKLTIIMNEDGRKNLDDAGKKLFDAISEGKMLPLLPMKETELACIQPFVEPSSYIAKIEEIQESIRRGDVYQVNLSQEAIFSGTKDPFGLFTKLCEINPAPFSAFLRLEEGCIVSSSPERLLQKKDGMLETRPIKGTRPRGKNRSEDQRQKEELLSSIKERSELAMIVDLMRNDLARISIAGSVQVKELYRSETYQNVHHLLSVIQAKAKNISSIEMLQSVFPGGSVTGCPKVAAMLKIQQLEKRKRGLYTGSIGYIRENGDFDWNIAIRSIVMNDSFLSFATGGAIVIDSDPYQEYQETFHKAASIIKVLKDEA